MFLSEQTGMKKIKKMRLELGFDNSSEDIEVYGVFYICDKNWILRPNQVNGKFALNCSNEVTASKKS